MQNIDQYVDLVIEMAVKFGPKIIAAIVVWVVGMWVVQRINRIFQSLLERNLDNSTLQSFLSAVVNFLLKVVVIIAVLGVLGIEMTSFIAILGSAGFAIGLALSGNLQNFAGGIVIIILKPIKVGDYIDAQGHSGTVKEIQIFHTVLNTVDNKLIYIPNGSLSSGSITNFSTEPLRRVDITYGIAYGDDVEHAKTVLRQLYESDERVLKDPEVFIRVTALADSSVNITVRAWVDSSNYWPVYHDMLETVYKTFPQENLNIPFPQMDVHVHNAK